MGKIGLFGGTFNPPHYGHLKIAEAFIKQAQLTRCVFIPANVSPFKTDEKYPNELDASHRLNMLKLALEAFPEMEYDDFEIRSGGISYTYLTLEYYRAKFPDSELYWLIGGDHIRKFNQWRNYERILEIARLAVVNRNSELTRGDIDLLNDLTNGKFEIINLPLINISSSEIRELIQKGLTIEGLVPANVEEYIKLQKIFQ